MKFDFNKSLQDINDKPMTEFEYNDKSIKPEYYPDGSMKPKLDGKENPVMKKITFRTTAMGQLFILSQKDIDGKIAENIKLDRFDLARRIQRSKDPIELNIDELKILKDLMIERTQTLIAGQFRDFLEDKKIKAVPDKEKTG